MVLLHKSYSLFFLMISLLVYACNTDEIDPPGQEEVAWAKTEIAISAAIDLIQELAFKGIEATQPAGDRDEGAFLSCAIVKKEIVDSLSHVVTIDFGSGCTGVFSTSMEGSLIVKHDAKTWNHGSVIEVIADSFRVNGLLVEGAITMVYNGRYGYEGKVHDVTLRGGIFTFSDNKFITREETSTRIWVRSTTDPFADVVKIFGSASGSDKEKNPYTIDILEAIVSDRTCMYDGQNTLPVFGIKEISAKKLFFTVGFGDGQCDTKIVLTKEGKSKSILF